MDVSNLKCDLPFQSVCQDTVHRLPHDWRTHEARPVAFNGHHWMGTQWGLLSAPCRSLEWEALIQIKAVANESDPFS